MLPINHILCPVDFSDTSLRIVCAVDFSPSSHMALRFAFSLAQQSQAGLTWCTCSSGRAATKRQRARGLCDSG